jgi:hypothetical protein
LARGCAVNEAKDGNSAACRFILIPLKNNF